MIDKIGLSILTMFGIGYIKYAPGTVASLVTCLLYYILTVIEINFKYFLFIFIILLIYSIIFIDKLSHHFKKKDPEEIVIDEFFGQSVPLLVPIMMSTSFNFRKEEFFFFFSAFFLFRFFDILKPFPINLIDKKMKNGLGVILDDIVAGIYTIITISISMFVYFVTSNFFNHA